MSPGRKATGNTRVRTVGTSAQERRENREKLHGDAGNTAARTASEVAMALISAKGTGKRIKNGRKVTCADDEEERKAGRKRRQNVHNKQWTDEGKADRIAKSEQNDGPFHQRIRNSDLPNGLPLKGKPNSIIDKLSDDGKVLQRRKYGSDGMASVDYDTTNHNRPDLHPTGAHKHIFDYSTGKPIRSKKNYSLTREELQENADIIEEGVNYHDES